MPKITQFPFDPKFISLSVERDATRSSGIHLSTIIRDRLTTAGIERRVKGKPFTAEELHLIFQQGFLWERMVSEYVQSYENRAMEWEWFIKAKLQAITDDSIAKSNGDIVRPGECSLDGIAMTPDAINIRLRHVEEWKATSIRAKDFDIQARKPEWLWQTGAYVKVFGMVKAIIRVWHFCQLPPVVNQWVIEWTQEEIDENWRQIVEHLEFMKKRRVGLESGSKENL